MENFQRNFSTGEVEVEGSVIYHKTEYKERRNHYAFYGVNADIAGFDTDRETFVGLYNGFDEPEVVLAGKARNSIAHGWSPIASHALDVTLKAGDGLHGRLPRRIPHRPRAGALDAIRPTGDGNGALDVRPTCTSSGPGRDRTARARAAP